MTSRMLRDGLIGAGLLAVSVAAFVLWVSAPEGLPSDDQASAMPAPIAQLPSTASGNALAERQSALPEVPGTETLAAYQTPKRWAEKPFAHSLRDTEIDGALSADANGKLRLNLGVRDFFDYFLATVGEVSPEEAVAQIEAMANAHLPRSAAIEAMTLLGQYLSFKEAALALSAQPIDAVADGAYQIDRLAYGMDELKRLRREYMDGTAVDAFFADEEAYGDYTLSVLAIQQNDQLDETAKAKAVVQARVQLPASLLQAEQDMAARQAQVEMVNQIASSAKTPAEAEQRLRAANVASAQIEQVVEQMQQTAAFDQRYAEYADARQRLQQSAMAAADKAAALTELQTRYFADEQTLTMARLRDLDAPL